MSESFKTGGIYMEQQEGDYLLVEAYGDGGFRFLGRRVEGSVLVTEAGFFPVEAASMAELVSGHIAAIAGATERPEILLVGTGEKMALPPASVRKMLQETGLGYELMDTGAAARTFNLLRMENRRVAALLIQVP